jgi:hypothetical protein
VDRGQILCDPGLGPLAFDSEYKAAITLEAECLSDGYELRGVLQSITSIYGGSCGCIDLVLVRDCLKTATS